MRDEELQRALASFPRQEASAEFTADVLGRISERPRARRRIWRLATAAAILLALLAGGREAWHRRERQQEVERFAALQAEYVALQAEVRRLRSLTVSARPVVVLGGDSEVDLMVDLIRLPTVQPARGPGPRTKDGEASGEALGSEDSQRLLEELLLPRSEARQIY